MKYFLTTTNHNGLVFYGLKYKDGENTTSINDISADKKKMKRLLSRLRKGRASALTLMDIVYDFME